jgi:hypothetical protein
MMLRVRLAWLLSWILSLWLLWSERRALAATLIDASAYRRVESVYFAPDIDGDARRGLLEQLADARRRVAEFFGPLRARPKLIFSARDSDSFMEGKVAATRYHPFGATIVVGPEGRSVDVLAHELAHAELLARIGYPRLDWCVPTWFDEGLAAQFDARPIHGAAALQRRLAEGWRAPPLEQLATRAGFFRGSRERVRFHYAVAKAQLAGQPLRSITVPMREQPWYLSVILRCADSPAKIE